MNEITKRDLQKTHRMDLTFEEARYLPLLYGEHDKNLQIIGKRLDVNIRNKGHTLAITGHPKAVEAAASTLEKLWTQAKSGAALHDADIQAALVGSAEAKNGKHSPHPDLGLRTKRGPLAARTAKQGLYLKLLQDNDITFAVGPAGTGKTYLAVAQAVALLNAGMVDRIILTRPAVEAGERLGFLPGDMREKIDPYLRPLYDALGDMLSTEQLARMLEKGEIEIAPLAFMRGRTLHHAFVILDEAQNTVPVQMKMFLTRLGEGSRMVVTGDLSQIDLPPDRQGNVKSGLTEALDILSGVEGIGLIKFDESDVVRHALVGRIVKAYDKFFKKS
ncbi:MAG: PhoH family protein [Bdellovibrionales bacterium]